MASPPSGQYCHWQCSIAVLLHSLASEFPVPPTPGCLAGKRQEGSRPDELFTSELKSCFSRYTHMTVCGILALGYSIPSALGLFPLLYFHDGHLTPCLGMSRTVLGRSWILLQAPASMWSPSSCCICSPKHPAESCSFQGGCQVSPHLTTHRWVPTEE